MPKPGPQTCQFLVIISASSEWNETIKTLPHGDLKSSPFGGWFEGEINRKPTIFMHGGWGKISAAASAAWAIQNWQPVVVINLGTCGGFSGSIEKNAVILAEETLVYDIDEKMGDPQEALDFYATRIDLSWLPQPDPHPVIRSRLVSADRDISPEDIPWLKSKHLAIAGDWESGAIAWVSNRMNCKCLILRGVSDLVDESGGEAYGQFEVFNRGTHSVMQRLLKELPDWLN